MSSYCSYSRLNGLDGWTQLVWYKLHWINIHSIEYIDNAISYRQACATIVIFIYHYYSFSHRQTVYLDNIFTIVWSFIIFRLNGCLYIHTKWFWRGMIDGGQTISLCASSASSASVCWRSDDIYRPVFIVHPKCSRIILWTAGTCKQPRIVIHTNTHCQYIYLRQCIYAKTLGFPRVSFIPFAHIRAHIPMLNKIFVIFLYAKHCFLGESMSHGQSWTIKNTTQHR